MNQEILLQERLQHIPQKLLIFSECPWLVQIRSYLLTHRLQQSSLETPQSSQDFNGMLRMVTNHVSLVVGLHKFMNGLSIPHMNSAIGIPNHHEFNIGFIQCQKPIHH
jgi:hypothetical protein